MVDQVELVDLARHATRVRQRLQGELTKARAEEIDKQDKDFREAREDLRAQITGYPAIVPQASLPEPSDSTTVEAELKAIEEHFEDMTAGKKGEDYPAPAAVLELARMKAKLGELEICAR